MIQVTLTKKKSSKKMKYVRYKSGKRSTKCRFPYQADMSRLNGKITKKRGKNIWFLTQNLAL